MGTRFRFFLWRWRMRLERLGAWVPRPSSPGQLMIVALALVAFAWVARSFRLFPWQPVGIVAVTLFLLALITSLARPTITDRQVRWRDRVVGERPIPRWERFYRWLYRK